MKKKMFLDFSCVPTFHDNVFFSRSKSRWGDRMEENDIGRNGVCVVQSTEFNIRFPECHPDSVLVYPTHVHSAYYTTQYYMQYLQCTWMFGNP